MQSNKLDFFFVIQYQNILMFFNQFDNLKKGDNLISNLKLFKLDFSLQNIIQNQNLRVYNDFDLILDYRKQTDESGEFKPLREGETALSL